jgi:hypothetical protein
MSFSFSLKFTKCLIFNSTSITKVVKIMFKMMAECVGVIEEAQGFEGIYLHNNNPHSNSHDAWIKG